MNDKQFVSVKVSDAIYAVTSDAKLAIFSLRSLSLKKFLELEAKSAYGIEVDQDWIICGCSDGVIRCFQKKTLRHLVTLPRPPPLGGYNIQQGECVALMPTGFDCYADVNSIILLSAKKLLSLYSDFTMFIWDLSRLASIQVYRALIHHSSSIQSVASLPGMFVTGSLDKTIRVWKLGTECQLKRNAYSRDLLRIGYVGDNQNWTHFKNEKSSEDGAISCLKATQNLILTGDFSGNVRLHLLDQMGEIICLPAHEQEVTCVSFNDQLVLSGGRDRTIHVFDGNDYNLKYTISDHTSVINDVLVMSMSGQDILVSTSNDRSLLLRTIINNKITRVGEAQFKCKMNCIQPKMKQNQELSLFLGGDKSLLEYSIQPCKQKCCLDADKADVLGITIDPTGTYAATICSDKAVRIYSLNSLRILQKLVIGSVLLSATFSWDSRHVLVVTHDASIFILELSQDLLAQIPQQAMPLLQSSLMPAWAQNMESQHKIINAVQESTNFFKQTQEEPTVDPMDRFQIRQSQRFPKKQENANEEERKEQVKEENKEEEIQEEE